MSDTGVDVFFQNSTSLIKYLDDNLQISYRSDVDNNFKKVLVLSAASYFENKIKEVLYTFLNSKTNNNELIIEFVKARVIADKYFQLFDWKNRSAKGFFKLFGIEFSKHIDKIIGADENISDSIKAFLEIGDWRNILVHNNFAEYDFPKTSEEVYQLYLQAKKFPPFIEQQLLEYQPVN